MPFLFLGGGAQNKHLSAKTQFSSAERAIRHNVAFISGKRGIVDPHRTVVPHLREKTHARSRSMGDRDTPSSCLFVSDLPSDITEKVWAILGAREKRGKYRGCVLCVCVCCVCLCCSARGVSSTRRVWMFALENTHANRKSTNENPAFFWKLEIRGQQSERASRAEEPCDCVYPTSWHTAGGQSPRCCRRCLVCSLGSRIS